MAAYLRARVHPQRQRSASAGFTLLELVVVIAILAAVAMLVVSKVDTLEEKATDTVAIADLNTVREAIMGSATAPGYLSDMKHVPGFSKLLHLNMHNLLVGSELDLLPLPLEKFNVLTSRGWRGPYLERTAGVANENAVRHNQFPESGERRFAGDTTFGQRGFYYTVNDSHYGAPNDRAMGDRWGNPIVVQIPPNSAFTTPTDNKRFRYARLVSAGVDGILTTPYDDRLAGRELNGNTEDRGDDLVLFLNRADIYETEEP